MIQASGDRLQVIGPMTIALATQLKSAGESAIGAGASVVDLSQVTEVDSASLAILFDWLRMARERGSDLSIDYPPESVRSLAQLYGVADLLPLA
ncbi:MAG: STAS domain-containing protein [Candidatus Nitricoxidivorans perseverans]|uniref:STAS domain-containing protein n=1 Tax=Candidatus Nitricoxidivorans perseverans TaxID=2975601 RepID=A0AA49FNP4_9PROT|nr:MAG: STAS domain-containing protein [Candidatus Nitricoxidivorans perseverans]